MKFTCTLFALAVATTPIGAQQPPTRPTLPAPAPTPAPPREPVRPAEPMLAPRVFASPDIDWALSGARIDIDRLSFEATQRAQDMSQRAIVRSQDAIERAMRDGQVAAERATQAAQNRLGDFQWRVDAYAPAFAAYGATVASDISGQITSALSSTRSGSIRSSVNGVLNSAYTLAPLAQARWQEGWPQERDPADSLFNSARDALNRGDWRRSADQFTQVYTKFPKSTRVQQAAYYEAFARYRIGTTDELRAALQVLNDRAKGNPATTVSSSNGQGSSRVSGLSFAFNRSSSNQNEVNVLTTRIRGALAARGDQEAMRQLKSDATQGTNCDNEDMQVRSEALSALAQSDMATATPMLRKVLEKKDPCTLELRRRALSILLRRADTAATSAAISVAKNADETIDLRTDAISYLARLPGDNALTALEDILRTSTDRDIQRAAIRSLANTDNAKARQSIRALVERSDVSEQLRIEALASFERDRGSNADDAAFLRSLYPKLQADRLKMAALAAISKNAGSENEQFVLGVARNPNESSDVRSSAISRMVRIPSISIAEIGKLYDAADSRSMRVQIINVLSQRTEPETVDKLGEIAKSSTDPSTRSQAINALNRKDDPRARKLVIDIASGTP
jgi:HEAT repeat protein/TolA-binding protein